MDSRSRVEHNNFYGFIPRHLEMAGRPELNLFPFNVLFASVKVEDGRKILGAALYEPDVATFREAEGVLSLRYDNIHGGSWVVIEYNTATQYYHGTKYVNGEEVGDSFGRAWEPFFGHFTGMGLANSERCEMRDITKETLRPDRPTRGRPRSGR